MAVLVSKNKDEVVVTCNCGCEEGVHLEVRDWNDSDGKQAFLSLMTSKFYTDQTTAFSRFCEKIKRIWCIIRNKEYCYFEIVMNENAIDEFKNFVANM